jgi:S1-C subfamily serine protease
MVDELPVDREGNAPTHPRRLLAEKLRAQRDLDRSDVLALKEVADELQAQRDLKHLRGRAAWASKVLQRLDRRLVRDAIERDHQELMRSARAPAHYADPLPAVLEKRRDALERLEKTDGDTSWMTQEDILHLEAIIVTVGRPAILIENGKFLPPPAPWEILESKRKDIEDLLPCVGRIEVTGHPAFDWLGTGFLVAPKVLMTNRHVVREFAYRVSAGKWEIDPGLAVSVDFGEEFASVTEVNESVSRVIGAHTVRDAALLFLESDTIGSDSLLLNKSSVLEADDQVYVVGYPGADSRRNDPTDVQSIFQNIFGVKRLQPGFLLGRDDSGNLLHDCSTLGGNSGSCLVSLTTGVVVGLHAGGRYGEANYAISMRGFAADQTMRDLGAHFV